jgi:hypothetical protein
MSSVFPDPKLDTAPQVHVISRRLNNASLGFSYMWWRLCYLLRLSDEGFLRNFGDFGSPYKMSGLVLSIRTR